MESTWDRTLFDRELKSILDSKLPVSASKITNLQSLATSHPEHCNYIVHCIVRFIETAPPDYRLAGLYVIDAISRAVQKQMRKASDSGETRDVETEGYLRRFASVLRDGSLQGCFELCTPKDKEKVKRTLDIWEQGGVYSKDVVEGIKQSFVKSTESNTGKNEDGRNKPLEDVRATNVGEAQRSKAPVPAIDTELLLATLKNSLKQEGPNSLVNVIPPAPSNAMPPPSTWQSGQQAPILQANDGQTQTSQNGLPPDLVRLLGGLVSNMQSGSPASDAPNSTPPSDFSAGASHESITNQANAVHQSNDAQRMPPPRQRVSRFQPQPPPASGPPMVAPGPARQNRPSRWGEPIDANDARDVKPPPAWVDPSPRPGTSALPGPIPDASLPKGSIRVLTRTLFVGPLPDFFGKADVAKMFSRFGELGSIIISRKFKSKCNVFLKFATRAGIEHAMHNSSGIVVQGVPVKVNWAYGFGPKKCFDYDRGESIIPLSELTEEEKSSLVTAPVGGFQGQPVRDRMTIEEPEVQYRPEWKKDAEPGRSSQSRPNDAEHMPRKRGRFEPRAEERQYDEHRGHRDMGMNQASMPGPIPGPMFYQQQPLHQAGVPQPFPPVHSHPGHPPFPPVSFDPRQRPMHYQADGPQQPFTYPDDMA